MDYYKEIQKMQNVKYVHYPEINGHDVICLYGAGALGHMAVECMNQANVEVAYIFDKKPTEIGCMGHEVKSLEQLPEDVENILMLITICTLPYETIEMDLRKMGIKRIMPFYTYAYLKFPDILSNGWFITDIKKYLPQIIEICGLLNHDGYSIHHYMSFLWWKCTGREVFYQNYPILSKKKYFVSPSMPELNSEEIFFDIGAHYGDTIKQFFEQTQGKYKMVMAFEPDICNLKIARERFEKEQVIWDTRAISSKGGVLNFRGGLGFASKLCSDGESKVEAVTIDELEANPTIIKIHVEGGEYSVLEGANRTIERSRPIIMVFADHSIDGVYKIPSLIKRFKDYLLFFNYCDYCGNSAIFYMIPKERITRGD